MMAASEGLGRAVEDVGLDGDVAYGLPALRAGVAPGPDVLGGIHAAFGALVAVLEAVAPDRPALPLVNAVGHSLFLLVVVQAGGQHLS